MSEPTSMKPTETEDLLEAAQPSAVDRGLRRSGILLISGLAIEALSLLGLHTPAGFLTFAILGGSLIGLGVLSYLWTLVPRSS